MGDPGALVHESRAPRSALGRAEGTTIAGWGDSYAVTVKLEGIVVRNGFGNPETIPDVTYSTVSAGAHVGFEQRARSGGPGVETQVP